MYPHLPVELYKHIIDNLSDDWDTLYITSFVCKAFLHESRRHLFYRVTISNDWKAQAFFDFIYSSTSPWPYIRDLSVCRGYYQTLLLIIAPYVLNITKLDLDALVWDQLDDDAQAIMLSSFQQVKNLKIRDCRFNTSEEMNDFIASFPSLTHLDCWRARWQSYREPVTHLPRSLNSVTLFSSQSIFFDQLLNLEPHLDVHTICLRNVRQEDFPGVGWLLKTLGSHLEHLAFKKSVSARGINGQC
jgi:hypothetical protein